MCMCLDIILKLFLLLFQKLNFLGIYHFQIEYILGTFCARLPLQFYVVSFRTLQVVGHGLKMCEWFGYNTQVIFVTFFTS